VNSEPGSGESRVLTVERDMLKKLANAGLALAVCFLLAGSATAAEPDKTEPKDTPEMVLKDAIKLLNDFSVVLEDIKDKETAEKAKPKLEGVGKRMKELKKRSDKLKIDELPKEEKEALEKKYNGDLKKAGERMTKAMLKAVSDPDVAKVLQEVDLGFPKK